MKPAAWANVAGTAAAVFAVFCVWAFVEAVQRLLGFDPLNILVGLFVIAVGLLGYEVGGRWLKEVGVRRSVEWQPGDPVPNDADFAKVIDRLMYQYGMIEESVGGIRPLWTRREEDVALVYDRLTDAANILEDVNEAAVLAAERSR